MGASASREKFRESVSALIEIDVSPDDADFWDELWKIPSSAEEVFELITPEAARKLRDKRFENLATLFTQATAQLCQIVETPYNIYFDQALNCVRVLTRILPFLLEKGEFVSYCICGRPASSFSTQFLLTRTNIGILERPNLGRLVTMFYLSI